MPMYQVMFFGRLSAPFFHKLIFGLLGLGAFCSAAHACESVRTPAEFLQCVLQRKPEIISARAEAESATDLKQQSGRWINPEIESEHLFGKTLGDVQYEHQIGLLQTFELGGKRGARIAAAEARENKATADRDAQIGEELSDALGELLQAAQLREELAAVNSAINAYQRMLSTLRRRSVLSVEQRSTLQLFQSNFETLEDTQASLLSEQKILLATLATDLPGVKVDWAALARITVADWPEISKDLLNSVPTKNPTLRRLNALNELAFAEYESASAEAWPDLKLGPTIRFSGEGPIHSQAYGLGVSISLPIWDARGPLKRATHRLIEASRITLEAKHTQEQLLIQEKSDSYRALRERILDRSARESFEHYIDSVESQYARGLLGPAHVIEAYRQRIEGLRSRFQVERTALSLLLNVWTSLGDLPDPAIKWAQSSWREVSNK